MRYVLLLHVFNIVYAVSFDLLTLEYDTHHRYSSTMLSYPEPFTTFHRLINKWNLSCYNPIVLPVLFGFRWFVRGGGGLPVAAVTLDTLPTRAERRWQIAWQGPRLGFVAETGTFVTMDALSTTFLLLCLASYFSYFLLPYPGMFIFFVFLRLCSIHLLLSASTVRIL